MSKAEVNWEEMGEYESSSDEEDIENEEIECEKLSEIITKKVYIGDIDVANDEELLKKNGIDTIINCAVEVVVKCKDKFNYTRFPCFDHPTEKISDFFSKAFEIIEGAKGGVLVHCMGGVSRSSTVVISYIMRKNGKSFKEAKEFVLEKRAIIKPNDGFLKQLETFEKELKK